MMFGRRGVLSTPCAEYHQRVCSAHPYKPMVNIKLAGCTLSQKSVLGQITFAFCGSQAIKQNWGVVDAL
ncbi:hypothetical protein B5J94_06300 [Moraxella lacunata]|uniref:Uncharacterized protein n=1 Tax=Moraxella lacunata TaxID=477 RepID=A0A1V4GXS6_MORLA|nr:hypothetical protein B5J94_06300 [Moraxella lacunata]